MEPDSEPVVAISFGGFGATSSRVATVPTGKTVWNLASVLALDSWLEVH
jgi:hypothetical protein